MAHPYLKNAGSVFHSGLVTSANGVTSGSWSNNGTGSVAVALTSPPDGSTACLFGTGTDPTAVAQNMWMDTNMTSAVRNGKFHALVYTPFWDAGTSFCQIAASFRFDTNGSFSAGNWVERTQYLVPGWNQICLNGAVTSETNTMVGNWTQGSGGTPDFASTFTRFRLRMGGLTGHIHKIYLRSMTFGDEYKSNVFIRVDDGAETVYTQLRPLLAQIEADTGVAIKCMIAVVPSFVGTAGYMDLAQLLTLQDEGHTIINHSQTHALNATVHALNMADTETFVLAARTYLINNGLTHRDGYRIFAAPYGGAQYLQATNYNAVLDAALSSGDISCHLGTTQRSIGHILPNKKFVPCMNIVTHGTGLTIDNYISYVRSVIGTGASVIVLMHKFLAAGPTTADVDLLTADASKLLYDIAHHHNAGLINVGEFQNWMSEVEPYSAVI